MTKSTITREQLEEWVAQFDEDGGCDATDSQLEALIRQSLAAMDSEPVAEVVSIYGDPEAFGEREIRPLVGIQQMPYGTKLYRHARQPVVESEPVALQPELAKVIYHFRDWNEGFPVERFKADYVISWMLANYPPAQPAPVVSAELLHTATSAIEDLLTTKDRTGACVWFDLPFRLRSAANAQPAPVVPDAATAIRACLPEFPESARDIVEECADIAENACSAAMLQVGNSPAQSDCCPAQNVVVPAQNPIDQGYLPECECSGCKATARTCTEMAVNSLVIPNEMTSEQAYEIGYYYGDPVDVFARGANWMRQHIIDSTLAAAPQEVKGE